MKTLVSVLRHGAPVFLFLLACALVPRSSFAVGKTGAQFLKIGVGAKARAMGQAFVALADDATATYWNPAGLDNSESPSLMGSYFSWFEDMSYQQASLSLPTSHGCIGAAVSYFTSGDIPLVNTDLNRIGTYDAYDLSGTVAYANHLGNAVSYGIGIKLIQMRIEEESATGFAVDFGTIVHIRQIRGLRLGASVLNLGPDIKFIEEADPMPVLVRGGAAYRMGPLTLASDVSKPRDNDPSFHFGCEGILADVLALRVGFLTRPAIKDALTFGAGIYWKRLTAGYAFVPFEEIEATHCVSVGIQL